MNCYSILIKIKDFFPKKGNIPFDNFICIFSNDFFEGRISLMQYEYQYINQEIKDINSDINYKINVIDFISKKLIGTCDYTISYNKIKNLNIGTSINFINQLKLLINEKSKNDLFDNYHILNDIYLTISTKIIKFNKNYNDINNSSTSISSINYNNKSNVDKNNIIINKNNKKTPFENIKIKKNNVNNKNNLNYETKNNKNNFINIGGLKKYKKNKNKKNIINKRQYASPLFLTEEDKKNINLNMHNICVQNYYTITSTSPININAIKKGESYDKNKSYGQHKKPYTILKEYNKNKELNNGIKRPFTTYNLNKNKNEEILKNNNNLNKNNDLSYQSYSTLNKNKKSMDYYNHYKNNKSNIKDKTKISKFFNSDYKENSNNNTERIQNYIKLKNNYSLDKEKDRKSSEKKNYKSINFPFTNCSSVDRDRNNTTRYNYSKILKLNNIFNSSTLYFQNKSNLNNKNKPFMSNLSTYLNSIDNLKCNMTLNSKYFLRKNYYNKRHNIDKYDSIISQKSHTLRENSNGSINKRNSNLYHFKLKFKNNCNSCDGIFNDKKNVYEKPCFDLNLKRKKNNSPFEINYKDKIINLLEYNIFLSKKLKKLKNVYKKQKIKYILYKENYLNIKQKKKIIKQNTNINTIRHYIHVNINSRMNNKIIPKIKKVKEKEINIYQTIFNMSINENDIFNQIKKVEIQKSNEDKVIYLLLGLIKNLINAYGNITQLYKDNIYKKNHLLFLLLSNGIEINNINFYYFKEKSNNKINEINSKYKCKIIKEEIEEEEEEEEEENNDDDNEEEKEKKLNISIVYKNDINIIDKMLINDFPKKYKNITDKTFSKLSSNEYLFNNEIKVFAYYKDEELILQLENNNSNSNSYDNYSKEYSLDEFISQYIKNKNKIKKRSKYLSPIHIKKDLFFLSDKGKKNKVTFPEINSNKKKKGKKNNLCKEKYSRNHKIINENEFNEVDFKKKFFDDKILTLNDSFLNDLNNINNFFECKNDNVNNDKNDNNKSNNKSNNKDKNSKDENN